MRLKHDRLRGERVKMQKFKLRRLSYREEVNAPPPRHGVEHFKVLVVSISRTVKKNRRKEETKKDSGDDC